MCYVVLRAGRRAGIAHHLHGNPAQQERLCHVLKRFRLAAENAVHAFHRSVSRSMHQVVDLGAEIFPCHHMRHPPVGKRGIFSENIADTAAHQLDGRCAEDVGIGRNDFRRYGGQCLFISAPRHSGHRAAKAVYTCCRRAGNKTEPALVRAVARDIMDRAAADGDQHLGISVQLGKRACHGFFVGVKVFGREDDLLLRIRMASRCCCIGPLAVKRTAFPLYAVFVQRIFQRKKYAGRDKYRTRHHRVLFAAAA